MTKLVDAAAEYLDAGMEVFALVGKRPHPKFAAMAGGWGVISGSVTSDSQQLLRDVFDDASTTGIGLVIPPGLCVVDIDGEEGARAYQELLGGDPTDLSALDTGSASTGRGLHLWYVTVSEVRSTKLGTQLDLKGVGGYVAAPPSQHASGAVYTWLQPLIVNGMPSARMIPEPVLDLLAAREEVHPAGRPGTLKIGGLPVQLDLGAIMDGLVRTVAAAENGERNNVLNWAAWRAREHGFSYREAMDALGAASTLPGPEVRQTVRSAYRG